MIPTLYYLPGGGAIGLGPCPGGGGGAGKGFPKGFGAPR